jgi:peptidoglycan hydrolase CwlO-like protein
MAAAARAHGGANAAIGDLEAHIEQLQIMLREAHRERDEYAADIERARSQVVELQSTSDDSTSELDQLRARTKQAEQDCEVARREARQLLIERDNANADADALLERVRALALASGEDDNDVSSLARTQTAVPGTATRGGRAGSWRERDDEDDVQTPWRGDARRRSLYAMLGLPESPSGELAPDEIVDAASPLSSRRSSPAEDFIDQQQQIEPSSTAEAQTAPAEVDEALDASSSSFAELERGHRQEVSELHEKIAALQAQLALSASATESAADLHHTVSFDEVEVSHSPRVSRLSSESEGVAADEDDGSLRKLGSQMETKAEQLARLHELNEKMLVEKVRHADTSARTSSLPSPQTLEVDAHTRRLRSNHVDPHLLRCPSAPFSV